MSRLDKLWAPWRLDYVSGQQPAARPDPALLRWLPGADQACFLCHALASTADRENLLVSRGRLVVTVLNRYPYNNGHLLVAPQAHKGTLDLLSDDEHLELMQTISRMARHVERLMHAEGFNVGLNLGRVAGAGLPGHLHWHIVPRWHGDTNFMPSIAGVKSIPQSLEALWELLREAVAEG